MWDRVKDSGEKQEFSTGSMRDTARGKGRFDLISWYAVWRLARHYENGAQKYAEDNWRKGQPLMRYFNGTIRHMVKWAMGATDEDHLAAAMWNIACIIEHEKDITAGKLPAELDNRWKYDVSMLDEVLGRE